MTEVVTLGKSFRSKVQVQCYHKTTRRDNTRCRTTQVVHRTGSTPRLRSPTPRRNGFGPGGSTGRARFFSSVFGIGTGIPCLAPRQTRPRRSSMARTVPALTGSGVIPSAHATLAAKASVHRRVGLPRLRGLWCNKTRKRSAGAPSKARPIGCGTDEPG